MKIHRITGLLLRHYYNFIHSYDRLSDCFYWPTIDLVLWGLTTTYLKTLNSHVSTLVITIISGLLLWIITWRGQYEISMGLLSELWDRNLVNIFVAPVTFEEWIASVLIQGLLKGVVSLAFASVLASILYNVNILHYGFYLIPFIALLLMTGWWIGFLVTGLIMRFGTKIQTFAWTVPGLALPFSAAFYPITVLPSWAQVLAHFLPTSYIFEQMRNLAFTGMLDWRQLGYSFGLNIIYLVLSAGILRWSFTATKKKGLNSIA